AERLRVHCPFGIKARDRPVRRAYEAVHHAVSVDPVAGDHTRIVDAPWVRLHRARRIKRLDLSRCRAQEAMADVAGSVIPVSGNLSAVVDAERIGHERPLGIERGDGSVRRTHKTWVRTAWVAIGSGDRSGVVDAVRLCVGGVRYTDLDDFPCG